jgi:hypothetical protein
MHGMHETLRFFWQPLRVFKPAANHFSVLRKAHAQCSALQAAMHGMHETLRFFGSRCGFLNPQQTIFPYYGRHMRSAWPFMLPCMACMERCGFFGCPCGFPPSEKPAGKHFSILRKAGAQCSAFTAMRCDSLHAARLFKTICFLNKTRGGPPRSPLDLSRPLYGWRFGATKRTRKLCKYV